MVPATSIENISGILIFQIADIEFCTDLKYVSAILKPNEIKHRNYITDKNTYSFSDLKYMRLEFDKFYSLQTNINTDTSRVIFLEVYGKKLFFYVDKVNEIITLDGIFIENSVEMKLDTGKEYVRSIMSIQKRDLFFPDFERIAREIRYTQGIRG